MDWYCVDVVEGGEVDKWIVGVDSISASNPVRIGRVVTLYIMIYLNRCVLVLRKTHARTNMVMAKMAPIIVQMISVRFRSRSECVENLP